MVGAVGDHASRFRLHLDRSGDVADFEPDGVKVDLLQRADRDAVLDVGLESRVRYFEIVIRREDIGKDKRSISRRAEFADLPGDLVRQLHICADYKGAPGIDDCAGHRTGYGLSVSCRHQGQQREHENYPLHQLQVLYH